MEHMDDYGAKKTTTIIHDVLASDMPQADKTVNRLFQEARTFVVAGTETTAWTLTVIIFHLLKAPDKLERLTKELRDANATTSTELEQLPYLSAIIQEGLRLSYGVSHRLPRIAPSETLRFVSGDTTWEIPPGVSFCSQKNIPL